jgi:malonyl-ACP O-methyltransferase BioC
VAEIDKDKIRRDFDRAAATYDAHASVQNRLALELAARIDGAPSTILELGCGTGTLTAHLRARFPAAEILAVDFSPVMAARAQALVPDAEVLVADVEELALDRRFDLTVSAATIQWLADPGATLGRIRAASDRLLLGTFGARTFWQLREVGVEPTLRLRSAEEWRALLGDAQATAQSLDVVYPSCRAFLRALKGVGAANAGAGSPAALAAALRRYDARFAVPGGVTVTYELVVLDASGAPRLP